MNLHDSLEHDAFERRSDPDKSIGWFVVADQVGVGVGFTGGLLGFNTPLKPLLPLVDRVTRTARNGILIGFREHLALLDRSARIIREDKRRPVHGAIPPIADQLAIASEQCRLNATRFEALRPQPFIRIVPQLDTG